MLPVASDAHVDGSNLKQTKTLVALNSKMSCQRLEDTEVLCSACASSPDAAAERKQPTYLLAVPAQPRPQRSVVARQTALTKNNGNRCRTAPYGLIV